MKENTNFGPPEEFVAAPLLSLVPVLGDVTRLEAATSSLYARYEKVSQILRELERGGRSDQRFQRERALLREVLDWLAVTPEEMVE